MRFYSLEELHEIAKTRELCGDDQCRDQTPSVCPCAAYEDLLRKLIAEGYDPE